MLFNRLQVSGLQDEATLEVDGGDSCTTMWMHLMPLKCMRLAVIRMAQEGSGRGGTKAAL